MELARLEQVDGLTLADEAKFEAEVAEYDVEHKLRAHQERLAQLEETVEAKRLEALALRKMKSVELELAREIHTLDDDIERIRSPIKAPERLTPVKTSKTSPVKRSARPTVVTVAGTPARRRGGHPGGVHRDGGWILRLGRLPAYPRAGGLSALT